MAGKMVDQYINRSFLSVVQSAANTLTFSQINFAVGTFQGVALILHRVLLYPTPATAREIVAATDNLTMAVTLRDDLTSLDPTNQSVITHKSLIGIGVNVEPIETPIIMDYTNLKGGGLLMPANPVYLAVDSGGFAAAGTVRFQLEYTFKKLSDKENLELLQTIIPGNV